MQRRHAVTRFATIRRSREGLTLRVAVTSGPSSSAAASAGPVLAPVPAFLDCAAVYEEFAATYGREMFKSGKVERRLDEFEEMTGGFSQRFLPPPPPRNTHTCHPTCIAPTCPHTRTPTALIHPPACPAQPGVQVPCFPPQPV